MLCQTTARGLAKQERAAAKAKLRTPLKWGVPIPDREQSCRLPPCRPLTVHQLTPRREERMSEQDRLDHLRIAALQQAVHLAAARPEMAGPEAVTRAAEEFFAFLAPPAEQKRAA